MLEKLIIACLEGQSPYDGCKGDKAIKQQISGLSTKETASVIGLKLLQTIVTSKAARLDGLKDHISTSVANVKTDKDKYDSAKLKDMEFYFYYLLASMPISNEQPVVNVLGGRLSKISSDKERLAFIQQWIKETRLIPVVKSYCAREMGHPLCKSDSELNEITKALGIVNVEKMFPAPPPPASVPEPDPPEFDPIGDCTSRGLPCT